MNQHARVPAPSRASRRQFLVAAGGAAALSAVSYQRVLGANERIGIGYIGFGLIGKRHVLDFQAQRDVLGVAACDVHRGRLEEARTTIGGSVRSYGDFRRLLDDRDVDAVVISTPDHWHALMTMLACAAGKDVYVEKPLSLFVREGRWMADVAARTRKVVQVGTQQRSGLHYQRARELIRGGALGPILSVRIDEHRNVMPGFGRPADCDPPPELDWEMFLGPAPRRPYNPNRALYHFRWFWDYSGGQMTNIGQHMLDIVYWYLGGQPRTITSVGGRWALEDNCETPDTQDALYEMHRTDADQLGGTYIVSWQHREASAGGIPGRGIEFFGTKGALRIHRKGFTLSGDSKVPPESRIPQYAGHPVGGPKPVAATTSGAGLWTENVDDRIGSNEEQYTLHVRNFLDCIKSRGTPIADLDSAQRVAAQCHLANISLRLGRPLRWDAAAAAIVDDAEALGWLERPYRAPWDAELRALNVANAQG